MESTKYNLGIPKEHKPSYKAKKVLPPHHERLPTCAQCAHAAWACTVPQLLCTGMGVCERRGERSYTAGVRETWTCTPLTGICCAGASARSSMGMPASAT